MIEIINFLDYGTMGIFIAYLVYDRQVVMKKLMRSFDNLAAEIRRK